MKNLRKILASAVCLVMLFTAVTAFAEENIFIDEEVIATEEPEELVGAEEVEMYADGAVCYIGNSIETGTSYASLKDAILATGDNGGGKEDVIHLLSDATWEGMSETTAHDFIIDGTKADGGVYTVTLTGDVTLSNYSMTAAFRNVTVKPNTHHFTIRGGNAYLKLENGATIDGEGKQCTSSNGGFAFVETAKLYMEEGSLIKDCIAKNGAAMFLNAAEFIMNGGKIQNCSATASGGAIFVNPGSKGTITLNGGTITGNKAVNGGGAILLQATSTDVVKVSGNANVTGNTLSDGTTVNNIQLTEAGELKVVGAVTGNIGITLTGATKGTEVGTVTDANVTDVSKIVYDNSDYKVTLSEGKLILAPDYVCYLGDDEATGKKYKSLGAALSEKTGSSVTIRIVSDVELAGMDIRNDTDFKIIGTNPGGKNFTVKLLGNVNIRDYSNHGTLEDVTFDLNGYHLSVLGSLNLNLNNGTILENGASSNGGAIFAQTGTVNLNEGSIIRNCEGKNGGAIFINEATVNINGGTITGCSATVAGGAITVNSNSKGTIVLNGGTISGNKAPLGGAIYLQPTSKDVVKVSGNVNVSGNTLSDGTTANNIHITEAAELDVVGAVTGKVGVTVTGALNGSEAGIVSNASVTDISKITYDDEDFTLTLKDGKLIVAGNYVCYIGADEATGAKYKSVKEAYAASADKNVTIVLVKDATLDAGTYNNGADFVISGENVNGNYTLTVLGDITVSGYSNRCYFEDITVDLNNFHFSLSGQGELTLRSGAIFENGYTTAGGGAVYVGNACVFTMEDGSVIKNCKAAEGGALRLNGSKMNMTGGEIKNCEATKFGGAIAVAYDSTLNMTGGVISGNKASAGAGIMTGVHNNDKSVANISGNVAVTGNTLADGVTKNNVHPYLVTNLNISGALTGNIGVTFDGATDGLTFATVAEGVTFSDSKTVAYDNDSFIVYPDGTEVKLAVKPALNVKADSGVYSDGTGVIRFLTTFNGISSSSVEKYGTYALATDAFDVESDASSLTKFADFTEAPEAGKAYIVDIINIPSDKLDTKVMGVSFVKIKGIDTPVYIPYAESISVNSVNETVKNLGDKVSE